MIGLDRPGASRRVRFGCGGATPLPALRVGPLRLPFTVAAWTGSAVLHAGVLTASYLVPWAPAPGSRPEILLPRGEQASRVTVTLLLEPYPAPDEPGPLVPTSQRGNVQPSQTIPDVADVADRRTDPRETPDVISERTRPEPAPPATDPRASTADSPAPPPVSAQARAAPAAQPHHDPDHTDAIPISTLPPKPHNALDETPSPPVREGVETGVEILDLPRPKYPSLSRRRGEQGLVLLQVTVLADASVGRIQVLRDAGYPRLTQAAIAAVRKARFKAAVRNGRSVRAVVRIPFRFVLR